MLSRKWRKTQSHRMVQAPPSKSLHLQYDCPGGSGGKESACNAGDPGSIPGSGRSPEEGNGHPFQYSGPEIPMDRGA